MAGQGRQAREAAQGLPPGVPCVFRTRWFWLSFWRSLNIAWHARFEGRARRKGAFVSVGLFLPVL